MFDYDAASDTFTPGTLADKPPQGNDAKCGFACHTIVKSKDYVFTAYANEVTGSRIVITDVRSRIRLILGRCGVLC